jgi:Phloem protein 2
MSGFRVELDRVRDFFRRAAPRKQACGPSPFECLPPDILLYTMQRYLTPHDIISVACVCQAARSVATKDDCWLSFLPNGILPIDTDTSSAFAQARKVFECNGGRIGGASRNLADRSVVSFLKRGDVRGVVRVSCGPGNEGGAWIDNSIYWERRDDSSAPGRNVLRLIYVWWLDVSSGFHQLPAGMYTLSFHILFDAGLGYSSVTSRHCRVEVQFELGDGTVRDTRDCGMVFSTLLLNEALLNRWLRIDLLDCEVLPGDAKLRLRLHHTESTCKSGIRLARCDAKNMMWYVL